MAQVGNKAKATAAALVLIASFEGYSHRAYLDPIGIPTICAGHTAGVHMGDTIADCDKVTDADLNAVIVRISAEIPNLPPEILGATADLCFNIGLSKCERSTLWKLLKAKKYRAACDEYGKFIYAHGKPYSGLIRRRQAERQLCMKGL